MLREYLWVFYLKKGKILRKIAVLVKHFESYNVIIYINARRDEIYCGIATHHSEYRFCTG